MNVNDIKIVTVVGGGLMGCGIAQVFAGCEDLEVRVVDTFVTGEQIVERIKGNLALLQKEDVMTGEEVEALVGRIKTYEDMAQAVKDAHFVIECIPENMELKQNLFRDLEPLCEEDTIFATNTSVMSITEIAEKTVKKDRLVGTHFWNPPYLIPLVEVVKAEGSSDAYVELTIDLLKKAGKHPIKVNKDVPGFVANRLQHALWREAISIVERGIADPQTVDEAIKMSFGLRLPVLAPMENADMVGCDLTFSIHDYILKHIESSTEPSPLLKEKVAAGDLGFKTGKGFMTWTEEDIQQSRARLTEHLIHMIYKR